MLGKKLDWRHLVIGASAGVITYLIIKSIGKKILGSGMEPNFDSKKPFVCSHITAIEGGSKAQNNLRNIQALLNAGIDMIEVDVQITKDGIPVLYHDNTLNAKTNGSGTIQSMNWSDVSKLRYKADTSQGIAKLEDAINLLKKSGKPAILQLDKCNSSEISRIDSLGLFKGIEKQILTKATEFKIPDAVKKAGVMFMPMIPSSYVGKMTNEATINEIVKQCKGSQFLEAQFSDADTLLLNGTLAKKLSEIGCKLFIVAVGGAPTTNSISYRGDSSKQWAKMINPTGAGGIMTNRPLALKKFIDSVA